MGGAFLTALGLVLLAELGDKTQVLVLVLASRHRPHQVLAGVALGSVIIHGVSVAVGGLAGGALPAGVVSVAAGVLFIGFGLWTLGSARAVGDKADEPARRSGLGPVLGVATAFTLAEIGDKTQMTSMTLAATAATGGAAVLPAALGTWAGAVVGMSVASAVAVVVGAVLGKRLPRRVLAVSSGIVFLVFGVWMLTGSLLG